MPVEEQTQYDAWSGIRSSGAYSAQGQRLTISNRQVTKLAFYLKKYTATAGQIVFYIRKASDESVIVSEAYNVADLPADYEWVEVTFSSPSIVNEEVFITVEAGAGLSGHVAFVYQNSDVKAGENMVWRYDGALEDAGARDATYRYTYEVSQPGAPRQQMATFLIGGKR